MNTGIEWRGYPNGNSPVHYWTKVRQPYGTIYDAACRTGAYHIQYTEHPELVTCEQCKAQMPHIVFDKKK